MAIRPHPLISDLYTADRAEDFVGWKVEAVKYDERKINFCFVVISHTSRNGKKNTKTIFCQTEIVPLDVYRRNP